MPRGHAGPAGHRLETEAALEERSRAGRAQGWRSSQAGAGAVPVRQPPARTQPLPEQQTKLQRACAQQPSPNAIAAQVVAAGRKTTGKTKKLNKLCGNHDKPRPGRAVRRRGTGLAGRPAELPGGAAGALEGSSSLRHLLLWHLEEKSGGEVRARRWVLGPATPTGAASGDGQGGLAGLWK